MCRPVILLVFLQFVCLINGTSYNRYRNAQIRQRSQKAGVCQFDICEEDPFYPAQKITSLVETDEVLKSFFNGTIIQPEKGIVISTRTNVASKSFCNTKEVVRVPKLMVDITDKRRKIVNLEGHRQVLKFEVCDQQMGECFEERILGLKTKCVQKYNNIKLVTFDENKEILVYHTFRIPATCICTYTNSW